ncbi:MAG: tRNA (adenosine(37)-N6)-threonylcarbamoyltransferase complex dimerization subunit type 1 TsaB, partial [Acinetobacter sp.]
KLLDYQHAAEYQKYTLIGSGSALVKESAIEFQRITATAEDVATIARQNAIEQHWFSAEQALPVYLRDDAWKKIPEQGKS